jgi:hypothetical protein
VLHLFECVTTSPGPVLTVGGAGSENPDPLHSEDSGSGFNNPNGVLPGGGGRGVRNAKTSRNIDLQISRNFQVTPVPYLSDSCLPQV